MLQALVECVRLCLFVGLVCHRCVCTRLCVLCVMQYGISINVFACTGRLWVRCMQRSAATMCGGRWALVAVLLAAGVNASLRLRAWHGGVLPVLPRKCAPLPYK